MASQINYTRTTQVLACVAAIGADICFNRGRILTAFATGAGNGAIELFRRVQTAFSNRNTTEQPVIPTAPVGLIKNPKHREYRMGYPGAPYITDPQIQKEALQEALDHVKRDYPEEYEKVLSQKFSTQHEILEFFITMLSEGSCTGVADALFEQIIRRKSPSLAQSVTLLDSENIFYHQILHYLFVKEKSNKVFSHSTVAFQDADYLMRSREEHNKIIKVEENNLSKIKSDGMPSPAETRIYEKLIELNTRRMKQIDELYLGTEKRVAEYEGQCDKHLENLRKNHHFKTFLETPKFPITVSPAHYREILETAMGAFPESPDFVGVIHIPSHVISFQYGPKGFFLFDPIQSSKGLFSYPDPETFCEELSRHVFDDACKCKGSGKKNDTLKVLSLEEREAAIEKAKQVRPHFSIRPLEDINPRYASK